MATRPEAPETNGHAGRGDAPRLAALSRFDFIDPEPGDILNRFARLAAQLFETLMGALCFVDDERVRFVARHASKVVTTPRKGSLFDETIARNDLVWIEDALEVEPFRRSELVAGPPHVRFYAAAPLKTPDGLAIGTLCVMDPEPRPLADLATRGALVDLAACAMSEMECWRLNRELEAATQARNAGLREIDLIYQNAPIGLAVLDREFRFRRINQLLADINGKPVDAHIGRTLWDIVPDLVDRVVPQLQRVFDTGEPMLDYELVGQTAKDPGIERIWMESYFPIPDAHGQIEAVGAVVQEVTEKRRKQAVERRNSNRLRRALDGIGALVGLLDVNGKLIEANKAALAAANLRPQDVLGKPFDETFWWAYSPEVQAQLREAMDRARRGETSRYDVPIRAGDKRFIRIDFQLAPLHDDEGEVINLVASGVDVTERKAAEEALTQSESLFRETFEQTAVGIAHVDLDGRWLRVNDRLCVIIGHPRETLLAKTFQDITHPDDLDADIENVRRLIACETDSYTMEKRYVRADGAFTWANLSVSLRRDAEGQPDHFIAIVEDISARKAAEDRLAVVMGELNHRVKNTLATIQSVVTHASRERQSKDDFVKSVTGRIQALATAHDFLVRSQWQGAELSQLVADELRPYDLNRAAIVGTPLYLTPKAALAFCLVIHELATNAAKYGALSNDSGRVVIQWDVTAADNGKMFNLTWRERDGPRVSSPTFRGFGSEIVEQFAVKELGCTATMDFLLEGVRVVIQAPLEGIATDDQVHSTVQEPSSEHTLSPAVPASLRVLVVEDSALIALDLQCILQSAGHEVIGPASTLSEALALVESGPLDAALLDVELDGEMVTPLADKLRDLGVPFAFLTGFAGIVAALQGHEGSPILTKPFDDRSVLAILALLSDKKRYWALLTIVYCSTDCLCRAGAAV